MKINAILYLQHLLYTQWISLDTILAAFPIPYDGDRYDTVLVAMCRTMEIVHNTIRSKYPMMEIDTILYSQRILFTMEVAHDVVQWRLLRVGRLFSISLAISDW